MSKRRKRWGQGMAEEAYQLLFAEIPGEQALEDLHKSRRCIDGYRTWETQAGEMLYVKAGPVWSTQALYGRARDEAERLRQLEAQRRLNDRRAADRIVILANANFTDQDVVLHATYAGQVPTLEQARKDIRNYIGRVKTWRRQHGITEALKYLYVIEYSDEEGQSKRIHHHIMLSGMDRDAAERLWEQGRANCDRLKPDDFGLEGMARYMVKAQRSAKWEKKCGRSRNLLCPETKPSNRKITRRKAEQLAMQFEEVSREVMERAYPGYRLIDCQVRTSSFVPGAYITARMRREPERPQGKSKQRKRGRGGGAAGV